VKRIQDQQILIATDDGGASPRIGRQHDIVVAVATHWRLESIRRHHRLDISARLRGGRDLTGPWRNVGALHRHRRLTHAVQRLPGRAVCAETESAPTPRPLSAIWSLL